MDPTLEPLKTRGLAVLVEGDDLAVEQHVGLELAGEA